MKPTEQTCNTDRIDEYLDEQLDDIKRKEFESHLTSCEFCQIELQRRAADPDIWRDAVRLLTDHGDDSSPSLQLPESTHQRQRCARGVLDSLAPTDDPEMLGRIGDYEVSGVVGVGGMGTVLKGFDRSLCRVVAIKVMAPNLADSGSARSRFQREARAAAAITHDNVIDTYGVSEANGLPYLVMPFARGPSLQKRIDESGPLTGLEVVRIGRQISAGLAAAHEQGLVHRDIKPANILLNEGIERLWITDFGVARAIDDASMTQTGVIAGTPQYMSPEQARGESVDHRSDLFSMGSVLYTACTGRPPFRAEAAYGILRRITDTEPRHIRELNPDIPLWLCQMIERLMAKDAANRFETASEVAELLEDCLGYLQQPAVVELPAAVTAVVNEVTGPGFQTETEVSGAKGRGRANKALTKTEPGLARELVTSSTTFARRTLRVAIAAAAVSILAFLAWQVTEPADISGQWTGETWTSVSLNTVQNADGWYSGSFTDDHGRRGALTLEWSRFQRRYNGRWKVGNGAAGPLTLRTVDNDVRGAIAVDADSPTQTDAPRLRDFLWKRGTVPKTSGQTSPLRTQISEHRSSAPLQSIEAPIKGRIVRWGDGIRQGAQIEKGQIIAEIMNHDPTLFTRLQNQRVAVEQKVVACESNVVACTKNLDSQLGIVDSYKAQFNAYEEVKKQLKDGSKARVKAAMDYVNAQRAMLSKTQAVLEQEEANHIRQKTLYDEGVVSEAKYQLSVRNVSARRASLEEAKLSVSAAENGVRQVKADEKAKEQQTIADTETARIQLLKGESDLAKAESDLARAKAGLAKARKELLEMETRLARQESVLVVAPVTGLVTHLFADSGGSMVKEGDVICILQHQAETPDAAKREPAREPGAKNRQASAARSFDLRDLVNILGRSAAALSVAETIETAVSLGQRFRKIHVHLPPGSAEEQGNDSQAAKDLMAAKRDRDTAISILKAEREAVATQNEIQVAMRKAARRRVESGDLNPYSIYDHDLNVLTSTAVLQRLDLLIEYYQVIGDKVTKTELDSKLAADTIRCYRDAVQQRSQLLAQVTEDARRRFEFGENDLESVAQAEQAEAAASADLQAAETLLKHYSAASSRNRD